MPDKSIGWRRKIHSKPKDIKVSNATASRPETPVRIGTPGLTIDTEDTRSEVSEPSTPRRPATLARLVSGYRNLKDTSKEPTFAEPWNEDTPPMQRPSVDPLVSLQYIYSHMNTLPTRPIPVDCNSGLFHIFEDYRKVRQEKERLESLLQESFEGYRHAEETLVGIETRYQAEIRRLELLIARDGVSGMAGLMRARQDSVLKHKRTHRKTVSTDRLQTTFEDISMSQLDEQIRLKSQKVFLHRPSSPSGKMTALSRQFSTSGFADDLPVGTPPSQDARVFLSRKVKSELDLSKLGPMGITNSTPHSIDSGFSRTGDPLPDEIEPPSAMMNPGIDCDAFVALRELGTLVARKKGINTDQFVNGLMQLLDMVERTTEDSKVAELGEDNDGDYEIKPTENDIGVDQTLTPKHRLRHFGSQPQLGSEPRRRRHFSFEPGDDEIEKLDGARRAPSTNSTDSDSTNQWSEPSTFQMQISTDLAKPSKTPSPVQRFGFGSIRSQNALPGLQHDDRRTSTSSVLTAFRQNSSGSLHPALQSRSRSSSVAAIAAARAARSSGMVRSENDFPDER